jgi:hypothetical protein
VIGFTHEVRGFTPYWFRDGFGWKRLERWFNLRPDEITRGKRSIIGWEDRGEDHKIFETPRW